MHLALIDRCTFDKASLLESLRTCVPQTIEMDTASLPSLTEGEGVAGGSVVVLDQRNCSDCPVPKDQIDALLGQRRVVLVTTGEEDCSIFEYIGSREDVATLVVTGENKTSLADTVTLWAGALDQAALRRLDEKAKELGATERLLIENASSNMAAIISQLPVGEKGLVIAGGGNNGADVLSCARKLLSKGYQLDIALVSPRAPNEEVAFQRDMLNKIDRVYPIAQESDAARLKELVADKDFVLEGIFGIGLHRNPEGLFARAIEIINAAEATIISCDIPSGLPCDRKITSPCAVKADYTVTFLAPKRGFFLNGLNFCGKIIVTDIGFSQRILNG